MTAIALTSATVLRVVESFKQATGVAAETIALGAIVRLDTSTGKITNSKATTETEARVYGMALRAAAAGEAVTVLCDGVVDGFAITALNFDSDIYLTDTDGVIGDAAGTVKVIIGRVITGNAVTLGTTADRLLRIEQVDLTRIEVGAELGYLEGAAPGTVTASKVVIYDAAGKIVKNSAVVAALGTVQGDAAALSKNLNLVTGADATKGVKLPVGAAGDEIVVVNTDATSVLKVYPETGGNINAVGANTSVSVGPSKISHFICTAALTWYVEGEALETATVAVNNAVVAGIAAGYKVARGQHTTVDADDTVVTGLATVVAVVASLESDPVAGAQFVTAVLGNQTGAPAAGSIQIKSWKATATADTALIAATTFSKLVNWIAIGT